MFWGETKVERICKGDSLQYLQGDGSSLRVDVQLSRQDAELHYEGLLHFHLPVRKDAQLDGLRRSLSVPEEERSAHGLLDVRVERRELLPAVRAADAPRHLRAGQRTE